MTRSLGSQYDDPGQPRGSSWGTSTAAPRSWKDDGACNGVEDPRIFWPPADQSPHRALAFCAVCEVTEQCLTASMFDGDDVSIRGGLTAEQRRVMRAARLRLRRRG